MFIKFSDKTKKIMVKRSRQEDAKDSSNDSECIYLDEDGNKNRRIKVLLEPEEEENNTEN